jgi:hypothetical protein
MYSPWVLLRAEEAIPHLHFSLLVYTLHKMKLLGIDNVRGGPWMNPELSKTELEAIQNLIECEKIKPLQKLQ